MPQQQRPREADSQFSRYFYHWRASFSFSLRGSDLHAIAQIHVSRKRHFVSLGQTCKHLIFIGARDSYLNISPVHGLTIVGQHEMLSLVVTHGATRNYQHAALLMNEYAHFHIHIRQQLDFVVIHRAEHLAHAARSARHHLLGHLLDFAIPDAVGHRVPQHLDTLILSERTQVRLIHESAHAHVAQVRHFRQHVAQLHEIAFVHRQRIKRFIRRRNHCGRTNFFFQRGDQILLLVHAQARSFDGHGGALLERRLFLLKSLQTGARGREQRLVLRDFVPRRRPFGDQLRQRLLRSFEVGNLCFSFLHIPSQLRYVVRRPTGVSVSQFGPRRQQVRASLRKLRALVRGIQSQNQLAFAYELPFAGFHVRDESGKLSAGDRRRNWFHLAVAGDGRGQILARNAHNLHLRRRPALCQHNQEHNAQCRADARNYPFWLADFRHVVLRTTTAQASPEVVKL